MVTHVPNPIRGMRWPDDRVTSFLLIAMILDYVDECQ